MVKLIGTVSREMVPLRRTGTPNPELVPIVDRILELVGTGEYVQIEVADKKEGERTRESIRNQLKARGLNCTMATDAKMVTVRNKKTKAVSQKLKSYVYAAAFKKDVGPVATNGTVAEEKPKKSKKVKKTADGEE